MRCSAAPTIPGSRSTRSGSGTAPDGRSGYAENPPKQYQDILPARLRQRRRRWGSGSRFATSCGSGSATECASSGSTTRTPRRFPFWERLIAEIRREIPGRGHARRGHSVRPAVMQRLAQDRFLPVVHLLHVAQHRLGARLSILTERHRLSWSTGSAELLGEHAGHPPTRTLSYGGPARLQAAAALAADHLSVVRECTAATRLPFRAAAVREGSEEYLDSEKVSAPATGAGRAPHRSHPSFTRLNEIRNRHRDAIAQLSTLRLHQHDRRLGCSVCRGPPPTRRM